jgi:hypothetical protein
VKPEGNFHPIWGAAAPAAGLARIILVAAGIGVVAGAAATSSLLDQRSSQVPRDTSASPVAAGATPSHEVPAETVYPELINSGELPVPSAAPSPSPNQRGSPPVTEAAAPAATGPDASGDRSACNISACERSYQSFRASDCTYQPYSGPRRLCTR